jgi:haloacetate dehalogenase
VHRELNLLISLKCRIKEIKIFQIEHHTVTVNNLRTHFVEAGEGPPVILLHGFPETWYAWRHQIPELAKHYRVIAPDLRGYGGTEKPATGYDKKTWLVT